jgi:hypothetical protein
MSAVRNVMEKATWASSQRLKKICLVISTGGTSRDISDHADFTRHPPISHPRIMQSTTAMHAVLHAFYTPLALGSNLHDCLMP